MKEQHAPLRAALLIVVAYVVAVAAAAATLAVLPDWHPIVRVALADVAATVAIFAFSRAFDNGSFYDAYWSLAPMAVAPYLAFGPYAHEGISVRKWLVIAVVWAWGARLTFNWYRGWEGLGHEDWRYVQFRPKWGRLYWPLSFLGIHLFPTVCTFVGGLALFPIMRSTQPMNALDALGAGIALAAALIEALADEQLRDYRAAKAQSGERGGVCEVGLWRYSRHPNYFGECLFWVGLWISGVAAQREAWLWTASGPVLIVCLFVFASIPMAEQRSLARRPEFAEHQRRVSMLVPWFRRS